MCFNAPTLGRTACLRDFQVIFKGFFTGFLAVVFSYHKLGLCWCNPLARSAGLFDKEERGTPELNQSKLEHAEIETC